jgi:hypothetical protein
MDKKCSYCSCNQCKSRGLVTLDVTIMLGRNDYANTITDHIFSCYENPGIVNSNDRNEANSIDALTQVEVVTVSKLKDFTEVVCGSWDEQRLDL